MSWFVGINVAWNAAFAGFNATVLLADLGGDLTGVFLAVHVVAVPVWLWVANLERRA
jgi:hypothetical protein